MENWISVMTYAVVYRICLYVYMRYIIYMYYMKGKYAEKGLTLCSIRGMSPPIEKMDSSLNQLVNVRHFYIYAIIHPYSL